MTQPYLQIIYLRVLYILNNIFIQTNTVCSVSTIVDVKPCMSCDISRTLPWSDPAPHHKQSQSDFL